MLDREFTDRSHVLISLLDFGLKALDLFFKKMYKM